MRKYSVILFFLLLISFKGLAQNPIFSLGQWKFNDISGKIQLNGHYRLQDITTNFIIEEQKSLFYSGGLKLNTRSYIWHPSFLLLEIGGEFNPESSKDNYLIIPDRAETRTMELLDLRATFFNKRPISLITYANFNNSNINRENLTNVITNSKQLGARLNYKNRILPFNINYRWYKSDQTEVETKRSNNREQINIQGNFNKSFTQLDKNSLVISNNHYIQNNNIITTINDISTINLTNSVFFDKDRKYKFNSNVVYMDHSGTYDFKRITANERIVLKLPENFEFFGGYNFLMNEYEHTSSDQNMVRARLSHQLYLSLRTNIFYEYQNHQHTSFTETRNRAGINLNYTKKIPTGRLNITYGYLKNRQNTLKLSNLNQVYDEIKILTDDQIVLLNNENIDLATVVVKDNIGAIIYSVNIDYELIENNGFIEILRVPGGQINNGQTVLVDYLVTESGSYKYDLNTNNISVSVSLFEQFLELYYRGSFLDYSNLVNPDLVTINDYDRNVVGLRLAYKFISAGFEFDNYNSKIVPYKSYGAFLNAQTQFYKFLISVNSNYKYYNLYSAVNERIYWNVNSKIVYRFNPLNRIDFEVAYRSQFQVNEDLSYLTGKTEYIREIRKLFVSVGVDLFHRLHNGEEYKISGVYCKIVRRF